MYEDMIALNKQNKVLTILNILAIFAILLVIGISISFLLLLIDMFPEYINKYKDIFTDNIITIISIILDVMIFVSFIGYVNQAKADLRRLKFGHKNYYDYSKEPLAFKISAIIIFIFSLLGIIQMIIFKSNIIFIILIAIVLLLYLVMLTLLFKTNKTLTSMIKLAPHVVNKKKRNC